eukprot:TRINITY_DN45454_c0_g1_i1.p1 TRINITY_DN45454_c0_g1~~TRINITY_DN45454_c0_g1_i1.p1  ORF type:complete len:305 (+),score=57.66 TRINITY_DN45454_c0_g1_i1:117-1031(+)
MDKPSAASAGDRNVHIAGQPTAEHVAEWAKDGVKVVVNVRQPSEETFWAAEKDAVESSGMRYFNVPVAGPADTTLPKAAAVRVAMLAGGGSRVAVHCVKGGRAGALAALAETSIIGRTAPAVLARAEALGVSKGHPMYEAVQDAARAADITRDALGCRVVPYAQIGAEEVAQWAGESCGTIINLRADGEDGFWAAERDAVTAAQMRYVHIPVKGKGGVTKAAAAALLKALRDSSAAPSPSDASRAGLPTVVVHCRTASRVGALTALAVALATQSTDKDALRFLARQLGAAEDLAARAVEALEEE